MCDTHIAREQTHACPTRIDILHKFNNVNQQKTVIVICLRGKTLNNIGLSMFYDKDGGISIRKNVINLRKIKNFSCCKSTYKKNSYYYFRKMIKLAKPETYQGKRTAENLGIKTKVKTNTNKIVNIRRKERPINLNTNIAEGELARAVDRMGERFSGRKFSGRKFSDRKIAGRDSGGWRFSDRKFSAEHYMEETSIGCDSVYPKIWNGEVETFKYCYTFKRVSYTCEPFFKLLKLVKKRETINPKGNLKKMIMSNLARNTNEGFWKKKIKVTSKKISKHTIWKIPRNIHLNNLIDSNITPKFIVLDHTSRRLNTPMNCQLEETIIARNIQNSLTIKPSNMNLSDENQGEKDSSGSKPELKEYQRDEAKNNLHKRRSNRGKSCPP